MQEIITVPKGPQPLLRNLAADLGVAPRELVASALAEHATITRAAEALGVDRRTLERWMKRLGVKLAVA